MNYIKIICFVILLMLTGCAAREEPMTARQPKRLITQEDYGDLKIKPCVDEPVEVDYEKEGVYRPSIDTKR